MFACFLFLCCTFLDPMCIMFMRECDSYTSTQIQFCFTHLTALFTMILSELPLLLCWQWWLVRWLYVFRKHCLLFTSMCRQPGKKMQPLSSYIVNFAHWFIYICVVDQTLFTYEMCFDSVWKCQAITQLVLGSSGFNTLNLQIDWI